MQQMIIIVGETKNKESFLLLMIHSLEYKMMKKNKKLNLKRLSRFSDPFIHKILLVILFTVCHTIVTMLSLGIRHWIN